MRLAFQPNQLLSSSEDAHGVQSDRNLNMVCSAWSHHSCMLVLRGPRGEVQPNRMGGNDMIIAREHDCCRARYLLWPQDVVLPVKAAGQCMRGIELLADEPLHQKLSVIRRGLVEEIVLCTTGFGGVNHIDEDGNGTTCNRGWTAYWMALYAMV